MSSLEGCSLLDFDGICSSFKSFEGEKLEELGDYDFIDHEFCQGFSIEDGLLCYRYHNQEHKEQGFHVLSPTSQIRPEKETVKVGEVSEGNGGVLDLKKEIADCFPSASMEMFADCFPSASMEMLKKCEDGRWIDEVGVAEPRNEGIETEIIKGKHEPSTEEIVRIAGARFIQSSSQSDIASTFNNPFGLSFSKLSYEETKNVELVEFLLASAEKVGDGQFERASKLLNMCDFLSSNTGNAIERLVYYLSSALRERIDRETGRVTPNDLKEKQFSDLDWQMMALNPSVIVCQQRIPFNQVLHLVGIQAIVEKVGSAEKVHIIDLEIRNGVQWAMLMQALISRYKCSLELLKITAIGTTSRQLIEDTGMRLKSFANSMNIPFAFNVVMVLDMLDFNEDMLELNEKEVTIVYSEYFLKNLILLPNRLDSLMRVIRSINPCIFVVTEAEANSNKPSFVGRFIEALFQYSAYFDCFETCMDRDDPNRMTTEYQYFRQAIRNIIAAEGEERKIRHVKIGVWRAFFARFRMEQTELSALSLEQANLVLNAHLCGSFFTTEMNEKSLLIGWKGMPLLSFTVWKFT